MYMTENNLLNENTTSSYPTGVPDIMHYESKIWSVADLLLAAAIKQSDFPNYMMPFFALVMLEGRMRNYARKVSEEEGLTPADGEVFKEAFLDHDCGYNDFIVMQGKTLQKICSNDKTFEQDFADYLHGFDADSKRLLGIDRGREEEKYLNMDTMVANLRSKKILFPVVSIWAGIDLAPYNNSDITTLEEHIKRKWADISASTAGEQYTPADIIALISEIVGAKINLPKDRFLHIYDPTCGGANLLFGVSDRLSRENGYKLIHTCGSEYNDTLYALAAIESHFRDKAEIHYGNTLTTMPFPDTRFNVIVANPPYGTKWSGYEREIRKDQTGQFAGGIPSVSDGQLLFMQHNLFKLADDGLAVEVHNGASLFSGDAGSGESNIRKYVLDHDWLEAIIQMPQQEFFNTGIYTYLWVINKNKPAEHRNKIALIDGSNGWQLLKKSKGSKRREMDDKSREAIVQALLRFKTEGICKVYDREHFYYNKQQLILTELDDDGHALAKAETLKDVVRVALGDKTFTDLTDLEPDDAAALLAELKTWDDADVPLRVSLANGKTYSYDRDCSSLTVEADGTTTRLGNGIFKFSLGTSKKLKNLKVAIEPRKTTDYEIIPYHFDEEANRKEIAAFMKKYVFKPFTLEKDVVGVEINFNKEFYVPEPVEPVEDILKEIKELDKELEGIEI